MVDTAEKKGIRLLGQSDLNGEGDAMQAMIKDNILYVGRMECARPMLMLDVSDSRNPLVVGELPAYPGTWHTKCQVHDDILLVNYEQRQNPDPDGRTGWSVFDISTPHKPREITYVNTGGKGVHRIWWAGERYCYVAGAPSGFRGGMIEIYDLKDIARPEMVGRWWSPGLWQAGGEDPAKPARNGPQTHIHHGVHHNGRLYCGEWDAGLLILDVADPGKPEVVSRLEWERGGGRHTHTGMPLPGRNLLAVTDEAVNDVDPTYFHMVDIADETRPRELSRWRPSQEVFGKRGGRYGPHNLHENRPGAFQGEEILFMAAFNAGLHVMDVSDPANPRVKAYYVPAASQRQTVCWTNDVLVATDGRIFITDRKTLGVHILELE